MPDSVSGATSLGSAWSIDQLNSSVDDAANTTPTTTTPDGKTTTNSSSSLSDKDTFLKLLVAQLKYQNPMSPTDGSQYMAQLAQFTEVEKLSNIEKSQTEANQWQQALAGQSLVGQYATGKNDQGDTVSGQVTGLKLGTGGAILQLSDGSNMPMANVTDSSPVKPATPAK